MNIIHVAEGDYTRYEELLLQKDNLKKEAFYYQRAYTREFGDLTIELFKLKIDCISLKKSISFCIAAKNRGEKASPDELAEYLANHMAAYKKQLQDMIDEHKSAKKGNPISALDLAEVKKIYRRLAKLLHPDISTLTSDYPELLELFQRVTVAYHCNDLEELRDLEVLINKILEDNGIENINIVVPNVAQKILKLETEIESILTTEPYIYKDLLDDCFLVQNKKDEFQKDIDEYKSYKQKLEEQLSDLMGELQ